MESSTLADTSATPAEVEDKANSTLPFLLVTAEGELSEPKLVDRVTFLLDRAPPSLFLIKTVICEVDLPSAGSLRGQAKTIDFSGEGISSSLALVNLISGRSKIKTVVKRPKRRKKIVRRPTSFLSIFSLIRIARDQKIVKCV